MSVHAEKKTSCNRSMVATQHHPPPDPRKVPPGPGILSRRNPHPQPRSPDALAARFPEKAAPVPCGHGYPPPAKAKLLSRLPVTKRQPSTMTNSSSLNGSEINTGGSIIMPMLMRMLAMTMSITRNGR